MDTRAALPSANALRTLKPGELYRVALEPVYRKISIDDGPKVFLEQFARVSPPQGHLFASFWCQSEVCNGGLHQFFLNSTGVLAPEAAQGFRFLEMSEVADVVVAAMRKLGDPYPRDRERRNAALMVLPPEGHVNAPLDPYYSLTERFFEALGEFGRRADGFIRRQPGLFFV